MGIKLNGISVPIGGISWEYTESGQKGIQEMFYYLESKRLLINPKEICAGNFYDVPGHYIRRVNPEQRYKDTCMFCNVRNGYDYYIGRKNK